MFFAYLFGMAIGGCFAFITVKAAPLSRRERINATLETITELQEIFGCSTASLTIFEELDDIRVIVKEMSKR
jgi:hypothetical protein